MSLKRMLASALATTLLPAAAVVTGASPATAADLHFTATPKRVVINQSYENVQWKVRGAGVAHVDSVDVTLEHLRTRELADFDFTINGDTTGKLRIYDFERPGRYRIYGKAYDDEYSKMAVAATRITAKFASRATLGATRNGRYVTLKVTTKKYDGGYPLWKPHRKAHIVFQRHTKSGWQKLAARVVARNGVNRLTVRKPRAQRYRVVVKQTARVWGDTSRTVRR